MWLPWERDRLVVFADELLARGVPFGERIAASLAAENCDDFGRRGALLDRIEELELTRDSEVDELVAMLGVYEVRREHGVIVGLELGEGPVGNRAWAVEREPFQRLLMHREVRFVQALELPAWWWFGASKPYPRGEIVALIRAAGLRPRVIRVVRSRPNSHRHDGHHQVRSEGRRTESLAWHLGELVDPRRGLLALIELHLAACLSRLGSSGDAARARDLAARIARVPLDPVTFTLFARALWDVARPVRDVAFAAIEHYDLELAAVLPDLLRLSPGIPSAWGSQLRDTLAVLSQRPELVEAVAPSLDLRREAHRDWLTSSAWPGAASLARGGS